MKRLIFDNNNKVRNGWWILLFIGLIVVTQPIYKPVKQLFESMGTNELALELVSPMLIIAITWLCLFLRKEKLSSVGLSLNSRWSKQFSIGVLVGGGLIGLTTLLIWIFGGFEFAINDQWVIKTAITGFYMFFIGALLEELLHRGFIFQRLIDGLGEWPAQLLIATLFAVGHWGNPGMEGITQVVSSIDLFLGSILLGMTYIKTKSLALPIGLHLGWNWFQGNVLGFNVSGHEAEGWLTPVLNDAPQWLSGGEFGPEASIFSVMVSCMALVLLSMWEEPKQERELNQDHEPKLEALS